jgi:hypothetical protein
MKDLDPEIYDILTENIEKCEMIENKDRFLKVIIDVVKEKPEEYMNKPQNYVIISD